MRKRATLQRWGQDETPYVYCDVATRCGNPDSLVCYRRDAPMTEELSSALWTGIPATVALVLTKYLTGWARDILLFIGVLLACFAVVIFLFWCRDTWIDQQRRIAESKDRLYQLAEQARYLNDNQLKFVYAAAHIGVDLTLEGESYLRGTNAPLWFVSEFLSKSFSRTTYPVRNYSEGTDERGWSQEITRALIEAGYALPAHGNEAALWSEGISKEIVAKKLGLTLKTNPPAPGSWEPIPGK
jgi:hypothetical protein